MHEWHNPSRSKMRKRYVRQGDIDKNGIKIDLEKLGQRSVER